MEQLRNALNKTKRKKLLLDNAVILSHDTENTTNDSTWCMPEAFSKSTR